MRVDSLFDAREMIFHFVVYGDNQRPQACVECVPCTVSGGSYGIVRNLIALPEYPVYEALIALFGALKERMSDPRILRLTTVRQLQYLTTAIEANGEYGDNAEDLHAALIACGFEEERREGTVIILECQLQGLTR